MSFRSIHRRIALIFSILIIITITTGFAYRFSRNVLSMDKHSVSWLMGLHSMSVLGMQSFYPLIVGLATLSLIVAGLPMTELRNGCRGLVQSISLVSRSCTPQAINQPTFVSSVHRWSGLIIALPLSISALTGLMWTIQKYWLDDTPKDQLKMLMSYHQGSAYGSAAIYCTLIFLLTLPALMSGCLMLPYMRRFRTFNQSINQSKYALVDGSNDQRIDGSDDIQRKSLLDIDTDSEEDGI